MATTSQRFDENGNHILLRRCPHDIPTRAIWFAGLLQITSIAENGYGELQDLPVKT